MPNIKSAEKRVLVAERNRVRNVAIKSALKTAVKKVYDAIKAADQVKITEALSKAYGTIDKAVSKGVIHKNTAARKKSRLTRHVNNNDLPAKH